MLVGAPDADILREAIEELRKRTKSGAATFLVKVKAHRGESANEEADIQVDKATSDKSSSFRMARASPKRGYEDRKSTWNSGARKVIRRGSVEEEVRKHRDRVTGAWKQISEDASCDPSMITALQHGTWMDEEGLKKTFIKEKKKRGDIYQSVYGTWVADLMLRQDAGTKLKKLDVQEGKKDKLLVDHVTQVCEAHNREIVRFLQQVQGGTRPATEGSREKIGHNVHV